MTDRYPPFRLDMGGRDPGTLILPPTGGRIVAEGAGGPEQAAGDDGDGEPGGVGGELA